MGVDLQGMWGHAGVPFTCELGQRWGDGERGGEIGGQMRSTGTSGDATPPFCAV